MSFFTKNDGEEKYSEKTTFEDNLDYNQKYSDETTFGDKFEDKFDYNQHEVIEDYEDDLFEQKGDDDIEEEDCFNVIDHEKYQGNLLSETDDTDTPAFTFRTLVIGSVFAVILSMTNTMLSFRTNSIRLPSSITVIIGYPIGVAMSKLLPSGILNPGDFSLKEHVLLNIIASTASARPHAIENVVAQRFYLQQDVPFFSSLLFVLSTQLIGYGLAGMTRRFLIKPKVMMWPKNLTQIALFRVFHDNPSEVKQSDEEGLLKSDQKETKEYGMSRSTFFWFIFVCIFLYELIPNYFASVIQSVSLLCLFSSSGYATMLGSSNPNGGFGIMAISFDWSLVQSGGPLHTPYFAFVNHTVSAILFAWILPLIFQAANPFNAPFLLNSAGLKYQDGTDFPAINTVDLFNGSGFTISPVSLMDSTTLNLNQTAFDLNSPIYLTSPKVVSYLGHFMLVAAMLSHVILWYGKTIVRQVKDMLNQRESSGGDIHSEIMKKYQDIPEWVYAVYTGVMLVVQILIMQFTVFQLQWYGTLLAFVLAFIFVVPTGFIAALTNQMISISVITEMCIGFMMPGQTIQVMSFQALGAVLQSDALDLASHLKLGHYTHIPPIAMVSCQFIGTIIGAFTSTGMAYFMMDVGLPSLQASSADWTAVSYKTFLTSGAIWGSIGPGRMFGSDSPYFSLLLGFPIGIGLATLPWIGNRYYPSKHWHLINVPLLLSSTAQTNKDNAVIVTPFIVSTIFQWYIYNRHYSWWKQYNFSLSAALDTGTSVAVILVGILTTLHIKSGKGPLNPILKQGYCFAPMDAKPQGGGGGGGGGGE